MAKQRDKESDEEPLAEVKVGASYYARNLSYSAGEPLANKPDHNNGIGNNNTNNNNNSNNITRLDGDNHIDDNGRCKLDHLHDGVAIDHRGRDGRWAPLDGRCANSGDTVRCVGAHHHYSVDFFHDVGTLGGAPAANGAPAPAARRKRAPVDKDVDGGYAWVILVVMFMLNSTTNGIARIYGLIYAEQVHIGYYSREQASWPISTASTVENLAGLLTPALSHYLNWRQIMLLATLLFVLSNVGAWLSDALWSDILCLGVIQGAALSINTILSLAINNEYFELYRTTAYGITISGSTCGVFFLAPIVGWVLDTYNFRQAYLSIAIIMSFNTLLCLFIVPRKRAPPPPQQQQVVAQDSCQTDCYAIPVGNRLEGAGNTDKRPTTRTTTMESSSTNTDERNAKRQFVCGDCHCAALVTGQSPQTGTTTTTTIGSPPAQAAAVDTKRTGYQQMPERVRELRRAPTQDSLGSVEEDVAYRGATSVDNTELDWSSPGPEGAGPEGTSTTQCGAELGFGRASGRGSMGTLGRGTRALIRSISNKLEDNESQVNTIHYRCTLSRQSTLSRSMGVRLRSMLHTKRDSTTSDAPHTATTISNINTTSTNNSNNNNNMSISSNMIGKQQQVAKEEEKKEKKQQELSVSVRLRPEEADEEDVEMVLSLLSLLSNPYLHMIWIMLVIYYYVSRIFIIILVDFATDHGLDQEASRALLNYWSYGEIFGRIFLGSVIDMKWVSVKCYIIATSVLLSGSLMLMVALSHYLVYAAMTTCVASLISLEYLLINVFIIEYLGRSKVTWSYGIGAFITSLLLVVRPLLIGAFRDSMGSYDGLILLLALVPLLFALTVAIFEPWLVRRWPKAN